MGKQISYMYNVMTLVGGVLNHLVHLLMSCNYVCVRIYWCVHVIHACERACVCVCVCVCVRARACAHVCVCRFHSPKCRIFKYGP